MGGREKVLHKGKFPEKEKAKKKEENVIVHEVVTS